MMPLNAVIAVCNAVNFAASPAARESCEETGGADVIKFCRCIGKFSV